MEELRQDDPLENAIYILLKANEMRYRNIEYKHEKIEKLIQKAKDELDSYITGY